MGNRACLSFVIALIVLPRVQHSIGEEWIHVVTSEKNKLKSFVNVDNITDDGNLKRFKMYHNFSGYKQFKWIRIEKHLGKTLVNCDDKIVAYEEEQPELGDGRTAVKELKLELKPARPDSVDEAILDFVCSHEG